jgi:hypothetical protein
MKRHAWVALAVAGLGCGKKDSGPGIHLADAPGEIARAVCPKAYGCCTPMQLAPNDLAGKDEPSCEAKTTKGFKDQLDGLKGAIDGGRIAYHGDRLAACLAYLRGASCLQLDTTDHFTGLDCQPYLEPLVGPGGTCGGDAECIDGQCVKTGPESGPGVCRALPRQGESCDQVRCGKGFRCDGDSKTCQAEVPLGQLCTNDLQCGSGNCPDFGSGTRTCAAPTGGKCFYASACSYGRAPLSSTMVVGAFGLALLRFRRRTRPG